MSTDIPGSKGQYGSSLPVNAEPSRIQRYPLLPRRNQQYIERCSFVCLAAAKRRQRIYARLPVIDLWLQRHPGEVTEPFAVYSTSSLVAPVSFKIALALTMREVGSAARDSLQGASYEEISLPVAVYRPPFKTDQAQRDNLLRLCFSYAESM